MHINLEFIGANERYGQKGCMVENQDMKTASQGDGQRQPSGWWTEIVDEPRERNA